MDSFDRAENARAMHESRRRSTNERANAAIDALVAEGGKITFKSVAERAGLSTATLYNHEALRRRIESLREGGRLRKTAAAKPRSTEAAVIESLKRKVERLSRENERLREENERLRSAASKVYSDYMDAI